MFTCTPCCSTMPSEISLGILTSAKSSDEPNARTIQATAATRLPLNTHAPIIGNSSVYPRTRTSFRPSGTHPAAQEKLWLQHLHHEVGDRMRNFLVPMGNSRRNHDDVTLT